VLPKFVIELRKFDLALLKQDAELPELDYGLFKFEEGLGK
jgi:hypothetical protein